MEYCALRGSILVYPDEFLPAPPHYNGAITTPLIEALTLRDWSPGRSKLVDRHLAYRDAEGVGHE
jgi:hypothetical protein